MFNPSRDFNQVNREIENIYGTLPNVSYGTSAPTTAPTKVGDTFIDTSTGNIYISVGTSGYWNWGLVGKGSLDNFTSTTVANLKLWYRADMGVTKDANNYVSAVTNQAVAGYANLVGTSNPLWVDKGINNQNAFYFSGSAGQQINATGAITAIAQPNTVYCVFKPTAWSTGVVQVPYQLKADSPNVIIYKANGSTNLIFSAGTDVTYGALTNNTVYISKVLYNGASSSCAINNGNPVIGNAGTKTITYPVIGEDAGNVFPFTGYFAELLVFEANVSTADDTIIMAYLNNRYGVY